MCGFGVAPCGHVPYLDAHDLDLITVDDPVECPVIEIRDRYVIVDGTDIDYKSTDPRSSSAESDEKQGEEENPADDEPWDLPALKVGDIISVKVTCPVDKENEVWAEIVNDYRLVVITAPQRYLPKLQAGDVVQDVKVTDLRGQYFGM